MCIIMLKLFGDDVPLKISLKLFLFCRSEKYLFTEESRRPEVMLLSTEVLETWPEMSDAKLSRP
jgi:hypothetical protein